MCLLGMTVSTLQKQQKRCRVEERVEAGAMWDYVAVWK